MQPGGGFGLTSVSLLGVSQTQQQAKQEFARARRYGYPLTIGVCRIDRIDRLADLYGIEAKTTLMDELARLFHARSRSTDIVGRLGEDRLLWVLPHTDLEGAKVASERIRGAVEELELRSGTRTVGTTLSVGLACYVNRNTLFFDSVLMQAEQALHRAEDRGGNRVEWHPLPVAESPPAGQGQAGGPDDSARRHRD
jgi:diguanylate cyclase